MGIRSQRTQIIRHIAELSDHLGIAEIARSRVTGAAECDRAEVASGGAQAVRTLNHHAAEEFGSTQ
jgi:hypothetical protein